MPIEADGVADDPEARILVDYKATRKVPLVAIIRCARIAIGRRLEIPVNESWEEPAVTDMDGQSVIMVLCAKEQEGRRVFIVKRARYKPKKGW
jgi:hypothetical protein